MDARTIATYDALAEAYDAETRDFWEQFPASFVDAFAEACGSAASVLDVGSGPGRDAVLLRERGLEVACLDASRAMVEMTAAKGFASTQGDFLSLPFADAAFDGVWAYTSLIHVPKGEADRALAEIRRVLKADGALALGLIEGETEEYRLTSGVAEPRWFSFYGEAEMRDLLARHGFSIQLFEGIKPRSKRYLHVVARRRPGI